MALIKNCAEVIDERRKERGMTVRALSQKAGIQENALYNIFAGSRKVIASELIVLSDVLGLSLDDYRENVQKAI